MVKDTFTASLSTLDSDVVPFVMTNIEDITNSVKDIATNFLYVNEGYCQ